ncbi:MAG: FAD-dependent thymidylate synthase [Chloroflexota bacterium]|nr:FAD-dependent thymidylate synthase [Chloroflexota bacterium]MDE2942131.1 FAD-dependent thymidylate synthase [Chloroflexota bacterium]
MDLSRRIYPLDPRELTEEQLAVAFAMTSRNPQPFDEIARQVTEERAADFHERWVLNYGHASVAEHAVLHMAVENISRLACDTLEDNRLASYTEKSSRYQVLGQGHYHVPSELDENPPMRDVYVGACDALFAAYEETVDGLMAHLREVTPRGESERDGAYNLRLRRVATDAARFLLPASTLTNVGVTLNARSMEHAVRKLLSSQLAEEREVGEALKEKGREITPTLIKYADRNEYIALTRQAQEALAMPREDGAGMDDCRAELVHCDPQAEQKLVAALLYRFSPMPYAEVWERVERMDRPQMEAAIHEALDRLGPHDVPLRELEVVDYTFDLVMDYGAYREFKRHRMQTYLPQPATVDLGYIVPEIVVEAGLERRFRDAMDAAAEGYHRIAEVSPDVAAYLVTHAHLRRVLSKLNLRECYHLFKLRTSPQAHFTLRRVMQQALDLARERHPLLFRYLRLRG